jgi:hypothetical protein
MDHQGARLSELAEMEADFIQESKIRVPGDTLTPLVRMNRLRVQKALMMDGYPRADFIMVNSKASLKNSQIALFHRIILTPVSWTL